VSALTVGSGAAVIVALAVLERDAHETGAVYFLGGLGVAALAGSMLRRQEELVARLSDAHARQAAHAVVEERTRIAREVHDVVAHSLTVTMLHVTGARRALEKDPDRAADALDRAESVGRDSLESIRRVVGLLRTPDDGSGAPAPLPELTDIPALVEQYRVAGMRVSDQLDLDGVTADATTSLTAFRVVQEALANALQHAPGAPVRLDVVGDPGEAVFRIVAENPTAVRPGGRRDRVGLGLRGMAERVRAAGGTVEVGTVEASTAAPVPITHASGGSKRCCPSVWLRPMSADVGEHQTSTSRHPRGAGRRPAARPGRDLVHPVDRAGHRRGVRGGQRRARTVAVEAHRPDVVLMDIRMPVMDGIAATGGCTR
jgi:signal transduction histidine kinase